MRTITTNIIMAISISAFTVQCFGQNDPNLRMEEILKLEVELDSKEIAVRSLVELIVDTVGAKNNGVGLSIYFSTQKDVLGEKIKIEQGKYTVKNLIEKISDSTGINHRITSGAIYYEDFRSHGN